MAHICSVHLCLDCSPLWKEHPPVHHVGARNSFALAELQILYLGIGDVRAISGTPNLQPHDSPSPTALFQFPLSSAPCSKNRGRSTKEIRSFWGPLTSLGHRLHDRIFLLKSLILQHPPRPCVYVSGRRVINTQAIREHICFHPISQSAVNKPLMKERYVLRASVENSNRITTPPQWPSTSATQLNTDDGARKASPFPAESPRSGPLRILTKELLWFLGWWERLRGSINLWD